MITRCEMPTGMWSYSAVSLFSVLLSEGLLLLVGVRWRPWARDGAWLFWTFGVGDHHGRTDGIGAGVHARIENS